MIAQVPIGISKFDNVDLNPHCDCKGPKRPKNLIHSKIHALKCMEFSTNFDDALIKVYKK